jgi:hypothetical protein
MTNTHLRFFELVKLLVQFSFNLQLIISKLLQSLYFLYCT